MFLSTAGIQVWRQFTFYFCFWSPPTQTPTAKCSSGFNMIGCWPGTGTSFVALEILGLRQRGLWRRSRPWLQRYCVIIKLFDTCYATSPANLLLRNWSFLRCILFLSAEGSFGLKNTERSYSKAFSTSLETSAQLSAKPLNSLPLTNWVQDILAGSKTANNGNFLPEVNSVSTN